MSFRQEKREIEYRGILYQICQQLSASKEGRDLLRRDPILYLSINAAKSFFWEFQETINKEKAIETKYQCWRKGGIV